MIILLDHIYIRSHLCQITFMSDHNISDHIYVRSHLYQIIKINKHCPSLQFSTDDGLGEVPVVDFSIHRLRVF